MLSHIDRILHTLATYPFGCDFYNQNMIHLTENPFEEMFKARIMNSYIPNMTLTLKA